MLPGDGQSIFHCIFAPDLAALFVAMAEADARVAGVYNAGGTELFSLADLVASIAAMLSVEPQIAHAPLTLLGEHGVRAQFDLPLWLDGVHFIADVSRAQCQLGFRSTPLAETLRATMDAYLAHPRVPLEVVMDPDRLWELAHRSR